jgi:hypothetical protein
LTAMEDSDLLPGDGGVVIPCLGVNFTTS